MVDSRNEVFPQTLPKGERSPLSEGQRETLISRFFRYVRIPSQSDPSSDTVPSSAAQLLFGRLLAEELQQIGLQEVVQDSNGNVMATLPANSSEVLPTIGLIAHMDTSPDFNGEGVSPRMVERYDGKDIALNEAITLSVERFPELLNYVGQDLIVTDGRTLLGADDKAGVAEIVTAMEYLLLHPEIKHGKVRLAFTPDEEVGRGAHSFDVAVFGVDWAYTVDGGEIGELEYENFNAASAVVTVDGINVHPGYAKNKMVNSIRLANDFQALFPIDETPETTEKREGFFHLISFEGTVEKSCLHYIIRDHDRLKFESRKFFVHDAVDQMNKRYGNHFSVEISDQYYNMREKIEPVMHIVDRARNAMLKAGVEPKIKPIRGGTDGSQLSFMGLPCPNLFAGGHNFHGRYEFIPVQSMQKAVEVMVNIVSPTHLP